MGRFFINVKSLFNDLWTREPAPLWYFVPIGLLCLTGAIVFSPVLLTDSQEYLEAGRSFWRTYFTHANTDPEILSKRPPLYPMLLAWFGAGGALYLQYLLVLLTSWMIYQLAEVRNRKQSLLLLVLVLTAVPLFLFPNFIMTETLAAFLISLTFLGGARQKPWLVGLGLLLLILLKPVFLYVPIFILLVLLVLGRPYLRKWLTALLLPYVVVLSFMTWNHVRTGVFEYSSIQHINIVDYNLYQWNVSRYGYEKADSLSKDFYDQLEGVDYPTRVLARKAAFRDAFLSDPLEYGFFHIKGALRGLADPGRFELAHFLPVFKTEGFLHGSEGSIRNYLSELGWGAYILIPLALICLFRYLLALLSMVRDRSSFATLLALSFTLYLPLVSGPINSSRFMMPILPLLVVYLYRLLVKPGVRS